MLALLSYLSLTVRRLLECWAGAIAVSIWSATRNRRMPPAIVSAEGALASARVQGRIDLKDLRFGYNGTQVLDGVSVAIEPGEKVAIVGESGAGKTTLANLIPRFYELQGGSIALDGQDIRTLTLESLREQIAVVPQDPFIFSGTVQENIAFGKPDASLDEVILAAKAANIHDRVVQMPKATGRRSGSGGITLGGRETAHYHRARVDLRSPDSHSDEATSTSTWRTRSACNRRWCG